MRSSSFLRLFLIIASALFAAAPAAGQSSWDAVDQALGRPGTEQPDGVRRYSFPRTDLNVRLDGVTIKPALALGSWLGFQRMGQRAVVMGDLVLTPDEVAPVMSELLRQGLRVTALHNHLLRSTPMTFYMHVRGEGDPAKLAASLRAALALSHTPLGPPKQAAQPAIDLDTAAIDRIIGRAGKPSGGVYQFTVRRREQIIEGGMAQAASMGTGTSINFQPTGGGKAAVTGDFVLLAREVDPVMRALRSAGIEVTALHSHMLGETPRLYFMHFWGVGDLTQLASGLRAALDRTNLR